MKNFFDNMFGNFSHDIGIDLGTAYTPVWIKGQGIKIKEPSFVAIDKRTKKIIAVGNDAKIMRGRTPEYIEVIRPIRDGVISNFEIAEVLIRYFLRRATSQKPIKPRIIIGIPSEVTDLEGRVVIEATRHAGARKVYVLSQALLGAIGADLPVTEPTGSMVVDIGGGTTEVAVISLGGIVVASSKRSAGDKMDEAIVSYLKNRHNLLVGESMAEEAKIFIGKVSCLKDYNENFYIKGRDFLTGLPRIVEICSNEIAEAINDVIKSIADSVLQVLEVTPSELCGDISRDGITLIGGASQIRGLDEYLSLLTGVKCQYSKNPSTSVVQGTERLFLNPSMMKYILEVNANKKLMQTVRKLT